MNAQSTESVWGLGLPTSFTSSGAAVVGKTGPGGLPISSSSGRLSVPLLIEQAMLLARSVEPGVVEEVVGTAQTGAIGEEEEFRRYQLRGVFAVRRDDIGDARPAGRDREHADIGQAVDFCV